MTELETLAIGLFNRFAETKGIKANWLYLAKDRKIEWLKEVVINTDYILKHIKSKIKPTPQYSKNEASYGLGFKAGMASEKLLMQHILENLSQDLKIQLQNYINSK